MKEPTLDHDRRFIGQPREADEHRKAYLLVTIQHFIEHCIDEVTDFLARGPSWKPVRFRVIMVDSRPNFDTRRLVDRIPDFDMRYTRMNSL
jgi:hypothetical protein